MSSGRLQGFVNRSGRPDSPFASDRKAAQALKFLPKQASSGTQDLVGSNNSAVVHGYISGLRNVEHDDYQSITYEDKYPGLGLDSIVDSDFDHTRTESVVQDAGVDVQSPVQADNGLNYHQEVQRPEPNYGQVQLEPVRNMNFGTRLNEGNRQPIDSQYSLTGKLVPQEIRPPTIAKIARLQQMQAKDHELRKSPFTSIENRIKRVSGRSSNSEHEFSDTDQGYVDDDDQINYEEKAIDLTPSRQKRHRPDLNMHSSRVENNVPQSLADYDDETLKKMQYSELESQSWEDAPDKKAFSYPRELRGSGTTLETKIDYYLSSTFKDKNATGSGRRASEAFYEQLSSKEWDDAGEIFISKFTDLMQKLKEKRQEKRDLTRKFESIIHAREKVVRKKSIILDKKLHDMRTGGESLLVGSPGI